jgi:FkbM family methyltransferase
MNVETYWSHSFVPSLVRADGVVFDLGVNDGGFARLMAPRCREVIGYEPDPRWRGAIDVPANVRIEAKAIAAKPGTVSFHVNPRLCSSSHYTEPGARTIDVEAVTLEQALAAQPSGPIDLLKMDIEGEETAVLLQAPEEALRRVAQLTVEFHDFLDQRSVPDIRAAIARLRRLGFVAFCFSFRSYGDMLFLNRALVPLAWWQRVYLLARFKYLRGAARVLARAGRRR